MPSRSDPARAHSFRGVGGRYPPCVFDPPLLHVVLHEPEIPNNTGNIGRTCVATGCALHLIDPLGFDVSDKALRRAGLDYWPRLGVRRHAGVDAWERERGGAPVWVFSVRGSRPVFDADIRPGDHLLFGKETAGLPPELVGAHAGRVLALPMAAGERSLNLATVVTVAIYEGLRQMAARGEVAFEPPNGPGGGSEKQARGLNIRVAGGVSKDVRPGTEHGPG